MRHSLFFPLVLFAGCNLNLGTYSTGELGRATFAYTGVHCEILTCSMDHAALLGSTVTILATTERAHAPAHAYFPTARVGRITHVHPECTPEALRCQLSVRLDAIDVGDGELEILDAKGALID